MSGLFGSKNTTIEGDKVSEFQVNTATYGKVVPVILGTTRVSSNIIDYFDFTAIAHKTTTRTGKGGGSKTTNVEYTYTAAVLLGLCEGPIKGVGRIWAGDEIYTTPEAYSYANTQQHQANGGKRTLLESLVGMSSSYGLTTFKGEIGQEPWSYTESKHPEKALPYSGLAYMAGVLDLGSSGSLPQLNFEVMGQAIDAVDGLGCNPADVVSYIMTHEMNGIGLTADNIHQASLNGFRTFCRAADMYVSMPLTDQTQAYEIINMLCEALNTIVFWSQSKLKFVPRCDEPITGNDVTYTPNTTPLYDLNEDDFLEDNDGRLVVFERTDNAETYNQTTIEFTNRANSYETETVDYQILSDINDRGLRPMSTKNYHFLHTKERAEYAAQVAAMESCFGRNTYKFRLGWSHCLLEPGDIVTLTVAAIGLDKLPVIIETFEESEDDEGFEVEAKALLTGTYSPAKYQTYEADRPSVDYQVEPGDTTATVFSPTPEVSADGMALWIAASGGEKWGGCNVWISDTGDQYENIGAITGPSRHGVLTAALPAGDTTDTTNTMKVALYGGDQLLGGTEEDAQNLNTLCWLGGELLAYANADLTGAARYDLSYLVRGAYNTIIKSHASGSRFVRLDKDLFKYPYTLDQVGRKLYFKFTAYNIYGIAEQSLDEVVAVEYTLTDPAMPPEHVTDIKVVENNQNQGNNVVLNELYVSCTPPDSLYYSHAEWYIKSHNPGVDEYDLTDPAFYDVPVEDIGAMLDNWKLVDGAAKDNITIKNLILGETYSIKVVAVNTLGKKADFDTAPVKTHTITGKTTIPSTPDNFVVQITDVATCTWTRIPDTDCDFYELRADQNPGVNAGLLARTASTKALPTLAERQGTLYLYAHNTAGTVGKYSVPASYSYYKAPPPMPQNVTITGIFQGFRLTTEALPTHCIGINVHVDGQVYFSNNNTYTYEARSGIFQIQVAFVDIFGEGALSPVELVEVQSQIAIGELEDAAQEAIEKAQKSVAQETFNNAMDAVSDAMEVIDGAVAALGETTVSKTEFTQTKNELAQVDTENRTLISQTAESVGIMAGKLNSAPDAPNQFGSVAALNVKSNQIALVVNENKTATDNAIAAVDVKADGIKQTVASNKQDADGKIQTLTGQIATVPGKITAAVTEAKQDITNNQIAPVVNRVAAVELGVNGITSTVAANKQAQDSMNAQLQSQIDGSITTWFYAGVPTLSNAPANTWTTAAVRDVHLGDLYYDTNNKKAYRFMKSGTVYSWDLISDTDVTAALDAAQKAQDTADSKRRVFTATPTPPYDVGDLWTQGTTGELMRCKTKKATGQAYAAADWEKASKYTDDSSLNSFISGIYATDKQGVQSQFTQQADRINSVVTEIGKPLAQTQVTAILQMLQGLYFRAADGSLQSLLVITPTEVYVNTGYLRIAANTKIDGNVIASGMIQAGAVKAGHLESNTVSAMFANLGTFVSVGADGGKTTISGALTTVHHPNGRLAVRLGRW